MAPDDRNWSIDAFWTRFLRKSAIQKACLLNGASQSRLFVSLKWRRFFETAIQKGALFLALFGMARIRKHSNPRAAAAHTGGWGWWRHSTGGEEDGGRRHTTTCTGTSS